MTKNTLIIGYGNRDREDDGAGWHMLSRLAAKLNLAAPQLPGDSVIAPESNESGDSHLELLYLFQLLPELAEDLARYQVLILLDAHNSDQLDEIVVEPVLPGNTHFAFTHHLSPEGLLYIAETIGKPLPATWLVSVRGYSFRFAVELTPQTAALVDRAVERVLCLLQTGQPS